MMMRARVNWDIFERFFVYFECFFPFRVISLCYCNKEKKEREKRGRDLRIASGQMSLFVFLFFFSLALHSADWDVAKKSRLDARVATESTKQLGACCPFFFRPIFNKQTMSVIFVCVCACGGVVFRLWGFAQRRTDGSLSLFFWLAPFASPLFRRHIPNGMFSLFSALRDR